MEALLTPEFWIAVGQIIMIDILLGGDNAVVIALACRKLPPPQRVKGILWGTAGAIVLRVILIFFALQLLAIPFLKLAGAVLLVWIGVKLLVPDDDGHGDLKASDQLLGAKSKAVRRELVIRAARTLKTIGDKNPAASANAVMAFETALAQKSWPAADRRDVDKRISGIHQGKEFEEMILYSLLFIPYKNHKQAKQSVKGRIYIATHDFNICTLQL